MTVRSDNALPKEVPPKESPSHLKLLEEAKNQGQDIEVLQDVLWLITAHDHLIALPKAFSTVKRILDLAPDSWTPDLKESGILDWLPSLNWVLDNQGDLTEKIGVHFGKEANTTGKNPIRGSGVKDFPLYSTFCEIYPEKQPDQFVLLVGQFLIANVIALREKSSRQEYQSAKARPWKALPNFIDGAGRAVRRYSEDEYQELLAILPVTLSPSDFSDGLKKLPTQPNARIGNERDCLIRFLDKVYGDADWKKRVSQRKKLVGPGSGGGPWVGGNINSAENITGYRVHLDDGDDPRSSWGIIDIVSRKTQTKKERIEQLESDLCPEEDDSEELAILSHFDCKDTKQGLGSLARAARAKKRHIEKANQNIPWDYDGLAIEEIAYLRQEIRAQFSRLAKKTELDESAQLHLETLWLLQVMLWTGTQAIDASTIKVEFEPPDGKNDCVSIYCDKQAQKICWVIPAFGPEYKLDQFKGLGQVRQLSNFYYLPAFAGHWKTFTRVLGKRIDAKKAIPLFKTPSEELSKQLSSWLLEYSPEGRVTKGKIANTIWSQLVLHFGDTTMASCAISRKSHLSQVRIFYTSPSIKLLQAAYVKVVNSSSNLAIKALTGEATKNDSASMKLWMPDDSGQSQLSVGARNCPSAPAVKALFQKLIADVRLAKRPSKGDSKTLSVNFHNLYTLYVLQFFAYATTCRAIKTPYLALELIDHRRGMAALADKDDGTNHKSRLVWLPEKLITQMQCYETHLQAIRAHLSQKKMGLRLVQNPCFFLDDQLKPIEARPKVIEKYLKNYLDVKANSHRRFIRTELIEMGCPIEVVDALMGHWSMGEEPHGMFSSFNFGQFVPTLKEHLGRLHTQIGLGKVIKSPWANKLAKAAQ
jgi:hypothetical protein